MQLRTVVLLLLSMSVATCATIGHYLEPQETEEPPAVNDGGAAAAAAPVDAGEEGAAPVDAQEEDPLLGNDLLADGPETDAEEPGTDSDGPAGDAPAADPLLGNDLLADGPETDVPVAEGATAEEPGMTDSDGPAGDAPAADPLLGNSLLAEVGLLENVAADGPETDAPVAEGATAEEPGAGSDGPAGDAPAMEAPIGEAAVSDDEQPSPSENDIPAARTDPALDRPSAHAGDNSWSLNSLRNGFQTVHGYFDSLVELVGGQNGVCQYRCKYGEPPQHRPGYQASEPDGCSSSLVGFQLDLGIPAMTECCNRLDTCYETCGTSKYDCDHKFRQCLHGICSDLNKSLGFGTTVNACESMADTLYNTVWTLGCRPYMNSQRAACICDGEERDEL